MTKKAMALALAAAGVLVSQAGAADLGVQRVTAPSAVVAPAFGWSGFYLGISGGYGFGRSTHVQVPAFQSFSMNGGIVGLAAGYNHQFANNVVLGIEADISYSGIRGSTLGICTPPGCFTDVKWLGTARGRLGYAIDRFMPYLTAGAAFGGVNSRVGPPSILFGSTTRLGWTIGAGVEVALADRWTARAEYLYADLGRFTYATVPTISADARVHTVRVGVNYLFSTGPSAVVARY